MLPHSCQASSASCSASCSAIVAVTAGCRCRAVLPLQISQAYIAGDTSYGRVTMANIAPSSSIMWWVGLQSPGFVSVHACMCVRACMSVCLPVPGCLSTTAGPRLCQQHALPTVHIIDKHEERQMPCHAMCGGLCRAHWCACFAFLGWTFTLLEYHTRQYAAVRQHYLRGGDDPNYWRDLHMAEADGTHVSAAAVIG
jgi:hypothetical protein